MRNSATVVGTDGCRVGSVILPNLPKGWPVAFDTETNGLFPDGDPGTDSGDPGSPPARVSAASVAFRDPADPSRIVKHAWGFDQGPHPDKPGRVRRPREGGGIEPFDEVKMLATLAKYGYGTGKTYRVLNKKGQPTGRELMEPWTWEQVYRAEGLDSWMRLLYWLSERDLIVMHNAKFDLIGAAVGVSDRVIVDELTTRPKGDRLLNNMRAPAADALQRTFNKGVSLAGLVGLDLDFDEYGDPRPVRGIWDTMLVQAFFDPLHPVALKKTSVRRRLKTDADLDQRDLLDAMKRQGVGLTKRYDLTPWPIMEPYAATDAELTLLLFEDQQQRIAEGDHPPCLQEQLDKEFELMRVLYRMERRGVVYDVATSRRGAEMLNDRMEEIEKQLPFDPNKLTEVRDFYFGKPEDGGLGLFPLKVTPQLGLAAMDEAQVRLLVQGGKPWASEYDEWSHCKSAVGKWYRGWAERTGADGRLRTTFKQCVVAEERAGAKNGGTISGRLAVGRVQLHAIPHNGQLPSPVRDIPVRSLIGGRPGHVLYEMDLPQGEVRIATVIVNCRAMWDVIDTGADLHGENAKRIFGIDETHPDYDSLRGVAKRIVFGTLYGAGVRTLRQQILEFTGLDYSENDTREAKEAFGRQFPEFVTVPRRIQRKADRNMGGPGYVQLIDGRRRWFGPDEFSHKAFNAVIQGGLAQTGKTWMIEVERDLPGIQVLAIHDSIVVEVPDDEHGFRQAQRVAEIGKRVYEADYSVRGRTMFFDIVPKKWGHK